MSINGSLQNEATELHGERLVSTSTAEDGAPEEPSAAQNGHASREPETPIRGLYTSAAGQPGLLSSSCSRFVVQGKAGAACPCLCIALLGCPG